MTRSKLTPEGPARSGRKPLTEGEPMKLRSLRMTDAEWKACLSLGGSQWIRDLINLAILLQQVQETMLISGNNIRLTKKESELLESLSRSSPAHIRTMKQLADFVNAHVVLYPGASPEEKMLRKLLTDFLPEHIRSKQVASKINKTINHQAT